MYTIVPKQEVVEHRPRPGEPAVEIIDHREQPKSLLDKKKRSEQLPYDTLKTQRDSLFQKELKYKKRIEDLEKDSKELLKTYETTYEENTKLKRILDNGPDAVKLKQLSKDRKEQRGLIDQLKDDNQSLANKLAELEKEVQAEKLKANDRSWDIHLAKIKKKRDEEDSIPTEGPFVAGKIVKQKRMTLRDEDGEKEFDAYDLEVDSLEKETKVLLNKVKLLKREKEQIDYAITMGKGAITKNKTVAKAVNDKLNRDLNKFVIRLQMLKMKQNAARSYCNLVTDESNPVINIKPTEAISGTATPMPNETGRGSRKSWKFNSNASTPKSMSESNKARKALSNVEKEQQSVSKPVDVIVKASKGSENQSKRRTSFEISKPEITKRVQNETAVRSQPDQTASKQRSRNNSVDLPVGEKSSSQIWRKVQSNSRLTSGNKQFGASKASDAKASRRNSSVSVVTNTSETNTDNLMKSIFDNEDGKPIVKKTKPSAFQEVDKKPTKIINKPKRETESTGRYTHGPEPVGRKGPNKKETKFGKVNDEPDPNIVPLKTKGILKNIPEGEGTEGSSTYKGHGHVAVYRINAPDDGYSLIRVHNHMKSIDRSTRVKPVPIPFKSRKTFDVRPGRSIIGNTGIRKDNFYKRLNDEDPYFGL